MKFSEKIKNIILSAPVSKSGFLVIVGIIGLLLVLISTFRRSETSKTEITSADGSSYGGMTTDEYTSSTEKKLESVISDMLGGSKVSVMITLESGVERIYADEYKTDAETKKDQSAKKSEQNDSNQKNYVVMKDKDGNEHALMVTEKMPAIRGVIIVCDSGQTDSVSNAVKMAVRSALNISDYKICIIGRY